MYALHRFSPAAFESRLYHSHDRPDGFDGAAGGRGSQAYVAEHGDVVAGRKIEVLLRDDTNAPETTKRYAQEPVTNDHAEILTGFGLTPLAFAAAPIATAAKVPMIVMSAGTFVIPQKSPYIIRTSFTLPQTTAPIAVWAAKHGIKKVFTLVADYAPGIDSETTFKAVFTANGGQIVGEARVPARILTMRLSSSGPKTPSLTPCYLRALRRRCRGDEAVR